MRYTVNIYHFDRDLEVEVDFEYDQGVHTYPNGDPGYSASDTTEILEVYYEGREYHNVIEKALKLNIITQWDYQNMVDKIYNELPEL